MGGYLAAGKLRKKIAILEKESKEGKVGHKHTTQSAEGRNRKVCENILCIGTKMIRLNSAYRYCILFSRVMYS